MPEQDLLFMTDAMEEAKRALAHDDIPVGAVVVMDGKVIGRGRNEREALHCPTAHAEIQALNEAAENHGHWNLSGAKLYVTLEPCPMCAGAIVMARIEEVIYATPAPKGGAESLQIPILQNPRLNHRVSVRAGPLAELASMLLKDFFREKRRQKNTPGSAKKPGA